MSLKNTDKKLNVIAVISNPVGYAIRYKLYRDFEKRMLANPTVNLITVECAYANRRFEVTDSSNPNHVQVRSSSELWLKENMINLGLARLPTDWEYVAWIDADIDFMNINWAKDTIWQLQHHKVVQLFSKCLDLNYEGEPMHTFESFCACYVKNGYKVPDMPVLGNRSKDNGGIHTDGKFWHPGFAWAARREAIEALGGVMEFPILGSADHLMSLAFVGQSERINDLRLSPEYLNSVKAWEVKALKHVNFDIGYVPGTIFHYFHGKKVNRGYNTRTGILVESQFNPYTDIKKDVAGVIHLVVEDERQRRLRDDLRAYFRARNEDGQD